MDKLLIYILAFLIGIIFYIALNNKDTFINISNDLKLTTEDVCDPPVSDKIKITDFDQDALIGFWSFSWSCCNPVCNDTLDTCSGKLFGLKTGYSDHTISEDVLPKDFINKYNTVIQFGGISPPLNNEDTDSELQKYIDNVPPTIDNKYLCLGGNDGGSPSRGRWSNGIFDNFSKWFTDQISNEKIKEYKGICFDMESAVNNIYLHTEEGVSVTHVKLNIDKLNNAFKICKDNGFKVMVTMSWFGQNQSTITNNRELTNMYFTSEHVDYISPQLYTGNCDSAWNGKVGWNQDTISIQDCSSCVVNSDETDAGHGDNENGNTLQYNFQNSEKIIWAISHINTLKKLKGKNFNNWNNGFLYWCMNE